MTGTLSAVGAPAALEIVGATKTYGGNTVLDSASFSCLAGEIHALVGENGAGKSTMMGIASGAITADSGTVTVAHATSDAADGEGEGLAIAYQDDALIPDMTVADNLALLPTRAGLRPGTRPQDAQARLDHWFPGLDARAYVRDLSVAHRQLVEIVRALELNPKVLLLDEPTAALAADDVALLFEAIRRVADEGVGVVFVSHRLPEVMALCDRVTVLRDGKVVAAGRPVSELDEDQLVELMVGRAIAAQAIGTTHARTRGGAPILTVTGASGKRFKNVSLDVAAGEIVGLAGIDGNGQHDLLRGLSGMQRNVSGDARVDGKKVRWTHTSGARRAGIVFVSSDRRTESLIPAFSISENTVLGGMDRYSSHGLVSSRRARDAVFAVTNDLDVRAASLNQSVGTLSGGNAQKVALARAVNQAPRVLLVEEPTQGVDVGAKASIYESLHRIADGGAGVVIVSSDAVELAAVCDRVLVFSRGEVVGVLEDDDLTEGKIVGAATTAASSAMRGSDANESGRHRVLNGDWFPVGLLAVALGILVVMLGINNPLFVASDNLTSMLFIFLPIACVAFAQSTVLLLGKLDMSVGPVLAMSTVVSTGAMNMNGSSGNTVWAIVLALLAGAAVGVVNGLLVVVLQMNAVVSTLATYILVQGVALQMAPTPRGDVTDSFTAWTQATLGPVPLWAGILLAATLAVELGYRRTRKGLRYRVVGSRESASPRLGISSRRVVFLAYVASGVLAAIGGIFFASNTAIGDARLGVSMTLLSFTAVVLGGVSTFGGRGTFVGGAVGAAVLAVTSSAFSFLDYPPQAELYLTGALTLVAIGLYSRIRIGGSSQ